MYLKNLNVAKNLSQYDIEMCGLGCMLFNYIYCMFCDELELWAYGVTSIKCEIESYNNLSPER